MISRQYLLAIIFILSLTNAFAFQGDIPPDSTSQLSQIELSSAVVGEQTEDAVHEKGRKTSNLLINNQEENEFGVWSVLRGLLGMGSLIFIAWVFSSDRRAISWKVVGIGLSIQMVFNRYVLFLCHLILMFRWLTTL